MLLNIYFADESRREDFTKAALDLLRHHGRVMDPVAVLQTLPKELPVKLLQPYLAQIIPSTAHKARHGQVVKSLYRYEHVRINCELVRSLRWTLHRFRKADHACGWWYPLPDQGAQAQGGHHGGYLLWSVPPPPWRAYVCSVSVARCFAGLALPSLLAARCRYPNDTVVHMHCAQESLTCDPVTGTKFSQQKSIV